jgi:hypothetical protein
MILATTPASIKIKSLQDIIKPVFWKERGKTKIQIYGNILLIHGCLIRMRLSNFFSKQWRSYSVIVRRIVMSEE